MSYPDGSGGGSGSSSAIVPTNGGANNGGRKQKQPRQILKEEEYQQTLSQIVQRDYYPALPSLHRDMAVLERRGAGDVSGAVAVRRAYRRVAEEEEKAAEAERQEDERARTKSGGTRKRPRPLERESVTGFHDRATSEDNEEFDRVTRREEDERIDRMRALYNARPGKGRLLQIKAGSAHHASSGGTASRSKVLGTENPLLPASDQFDAPVERVVDAMTKPADTNSLFFVPDHHPRHGIREDNNDGKRKADNEIPMLEGERGNSSSLMLPPPPRNTRKGNEKDPTALVKRDSSSMAVGKGNPKTDLVEYVPKPRSDGNDVGIRAVPTINAAMTRFPHQGESRLPPASGRRNANIGNIAMTSSNQSVASSDTDATTDLDATPMSLAGERAARADALARERESYVAMTPIILPGGDRGRGNESPITTWGAVAGTPLVLPGSQGNGTIAARPTAGPIDDDDIDGSDQNQMKSFALPAEDSIEATARIAEARLASRTKAYRDTQSSVKKGPTRNDGVSMPARKGGGSSKIRASTSTSSIHSRTESLNPAARALLARGTPKSSLSSMSTASGRVSARSSSALGSALRSSYTPMSSSRSLSSKRRNTASATPLMRRDESPSSSSRKKSTAAAIGNKSRAEKKAGGITDGLLKI